MHIDALVSRKRNMTVFDQHSIWYSASGVHWKSCTGVRIGSHGRVTPAYRKRFREMSAIIVPSVLIGSV